jgi:hypothetical protein
MPLVRHFAALTASIMAADNQGRIAQFFNSEDDASAIMRHLNDLDHIIGRLTLITSSNTYYEATKATAGIRDVHKELQFFLCEPNCVLIHHNRCYTQPFYLKASAP